MDTQAEQERGAGNHDRAHNRGRGQASFQNHERGGWRGRGRGRGPGGSNNNTRKPYPASVPAASQVIPGAGVSIVLKVDQPTGRQVQGIVASVLGRGNHPRGIKVQLEDGRVGRVQALVAQEEARTAAAGLSGLGRNGEVVGSMSGSHVRTARSQAGSRGMVTDVRLNDPYDYESRATERNDMNLLDYVREPKLTKAARRRNKEAVPETESLALISDNTPREQTSSAVDREPSVCPVCHDFTGDEAAVAFHVDSHFR